jgi:hypothetical protein
MQQGGAAIVTARHGEVENVAVGHARPQAIMRQPAAVDLAPAAGAPAQLILVVLSSSRLRREERHNVKAQR